QATDEEEKQGHRRAIQKLGIPQLDLRRDGEAGPVYCGEDARQIVLQHDMVFRQRAWYLELAEAPRRARRRASRQE
ncbi:unnamed protein product, partial [Ectocarpus sp. 4 AP-2014]